MGLDITLSERDSDGTEIEIASMNWLRNPFGLRDWAEDNYQIAMDLTDRPSDTPDLWYVVNNWNYEKSANVDRALFKAIVDEYWVVLKDLKEGYFVFTLSGYINIIEPNRSSLPSENIIAGDSRFGKKIVGAKYVGAEREKIAIPQRLFASPVWHLGRYDLGSYLAWYRELVDFAEKLQDTRYTFYCSN